MEFLTTLKEHQKKAVEKLKKIKVNALFMEMGTGKTRTMLEIINIKLNKGKISHVIWLCPCAVKENLRRDIIKHTGNEQKDLITICGIETLSTSYKWNSYLLELVNTKECYLIVDESSKVKNHRAQRTKNILKLAEKCKYKSILNGTPITKNEADLYSQMYILDWRILGYESFWSFAANHLEYDIYGKIRRCLNTDYLAEKIAPYSYQVKKSECLNLPDKTYDIQYFSLTDYQEEEYEITKDIYLSQVDEFDETTIYRLLSALQLVLSGKKIVSNLHERIKSVDIFKDIRDNPRIICLLDILSDITEKVIIFCKYTDEVVRITKLLNELYGENSAVSYFGEVSLRKRQINLDKFEKNAQFLVANKTCAGFGLNLQFCSYIIFYNNDFDYGTRGQAEDRVHRIGQSKNVHIIDICASNKLDERILACLFRKERIVDSFKEELERNKDKKSLDIWLNSNNDLLDKGEIR